MIIAIAGKRGSGKNTVADLIKKHSDRDWQEVQFAGKLKKMVSVLTGVSVSLLENQAFKMKASAIYKPNGEPYTYRELMQLTGTEFGRGIIGENVWVDSLFANYDVDDWLITDCRFPNEALVVEARGGVVLRVNRPGLPYDPHPSETALDDYDFTYVIENDGTLEDLERNVKALIVEILKRTEAETII